MVAYRQGRLRIFLVISTASVRTFAPANWDFDAFSSCEFVPRFPKGQLLPVIA